MHHYYTWVFLFLGILNKGWVQMMTAGRGVVHAEMPAEEIVENGGKMEGFQLWVNLPAKVNGIFFSYCDYIQIYHF